MKTYSIKNILKRIDINFILEMSGDIHTDTLLLYIMFYVHVPWKYPYVFPGSLCGTQRWSYDATPGKKCCTLNILPMTKFIGLFILICYIVYWFLLNIIFTEYVELGRWMGSSCSFCKHMRCLSISRIWRRGKSCSLVSPFRKMNDLKDLIDCQNVWQIIFFLVSLLAQCGFALILHSGRTNCHPSHSNICCYRSCRKLR